MIELAAAFHISGFIKKKATTTEALEISRVPRLNSIRDRSFKAGVIRHVQAGR